MNIFVGCSSKDTDNKEYNKLAEDIGKFIVNEKYNFVFGGCGTGLMGKIYSVVSKSHDSKIIVTIAEAYKKQLEDISYDEFYISDTVNKRKDCFIKKSDVMIFIPGGIGTVDEILTAIETKRSRQHNSPIIIININHYFDNLLNMFEQIYDENFADSKNKELYNVVDSLDEAIKYLS